MAKAYSSEYAVRRELAQTARLFEALDLFDMNGHVSVRSDGGCFIHSAPVPRQTVGTDDIIEVNGDGVIVSGDGDVPNEIWLHLEIYRARPEIRAIAHFHSHWTNILTAARVQPRPVNSVACVLGEIPVYPDPDSISTAERGRSVASVLGSNRVLVLRAHGAVVTGSSFEEVLVASKYLELNSEQQLFTHSLSKDAGLSATEVERLGRALWVPKNVSKAWQYYFTKAVRSGRFLPVD
ncbi:class II aldolase/adducin family protein [Alicyclobacillus tolerans]|uniref:class II aldolase/adducin family protein n=1 Tax=Alicyclobacillus tolerans TaxID=90970 RepID=UPI001F376B9D|nr:class II aldolase/adducin family protein [Alicyclobacillus tolerans]MCF8563139.1 class II aldolase/adducin family protein [Alicyclobacillus tolerans]